MTITHASRSRLLIVISWLLLLTSCSAPSGHTSAHRTLPSQTVKPSFVYREQSSGLLSLAWSPDGKRIVSGGADLHVWDATSGKTLVTYTAHGTNDLIFAVSWSPDGKQIVSGSGRAFRPSLDHTARVWDASTGTTSIIYRGHTEAITGLWPGPRMASASHRGQWMGQSLSGTPPPARPT